MAFKLPKYTELTNDQKIIAGLGFDKNILVSAAPGTGKTVIAIYRAHELSDAGKKVATLRQEKPPIGKLKTSRVTLTLILLICWMINPEKTELFSRQLTISLLLSKNPVMMFPIAWNPVK